ncbi:MAG: acyltransferase [Pseudoxanthomonas suwonensis]|nr:acyltransferase [Pseudoxanthomonas suwonensis]
MNMAWTQRPEGGGRFALRLIRAIARRGGRALARPLLLPITAYFMLVRGPERRASLAWLRRVLGAHAGYRHVARHIHSFASTILDRVFLLGGQVDRFDVTVTGLDTLHRDLDQGRGVLLFGSHLGSFEVLRVLGRQCPDYTIRVVLDKSRNPALTQLLDELSPEIAASVIDAAQDGPSIVMAIKQACDEGAMVALLVDRARPGDPALPAPFFGEAALFPTSPWLIAAALKVPVQLGFGLYRGGNRYDLQFEPFADEVRIGRGQRMADVAALIERYARQLENRASDAPYNWFNFYDFWLQDHAAVARDDATVQRRPAVTARAAGNGPGNGA